MSSEYFSKADLHIHSEYSYDAFSPVKKILERAKKVGLNLIAITDHGTIEGAKEAKSLSEKFGIEVVIGEEMETTAGDMIGLFLEKFIPEKNSVERTIEEIHKAGGLAIIPHPFNWIVGGLKKEAVFKIFSKADAIETFNAGWGGMLGRKESRKLNTGIFHLAEISSSDAHIARQVGRAYTIFEGRSAGDLYESIKNKKTKIGGNSWTTTDRLMWLVNLPRRPFKHHYV